MARDSRAWWPGGVATTKAASPPPARRTRDGARARSCGTNRRLPGCRPGDSVRVERSTTRHAEIADRLDVVGVVDQADQVGIGLGRLDLDETHPGAADPFEHRRQPGRSLGMVRTGVVLGERRVGEQHQVHLRTLAHTDPTTRPITKCSPGVASSGGDKSRRAPVTVVRSRGTWPGAVALRRGWALAHARPWNRDIPDAALRLVRGSSAFLEACADHLVELGRARRGVTTRSGQRTRGVGAGRVLLASPA